jgi:hypothetical protein
MTCTVMAGKRIRKKKMIADDLMPLGVGGNRVKDRLFDFWQRSVFSKRQMTETMQPVHIP